MYFDDTDNDSEDSGSLGEDIHSMVSQNIASYLIRAGKIAGNIPHTLATFIHHVNNC